MRKKRSDPAAGSHAISSPFIFSRIRYSSPIFSPRNPCATGCSPGGAASAGPAQARESAVLLSWRRAPQRQSPVPWSSRRYGGNGAGQCLGWEIDLGNVGNKLPGIDEHRMPPHREYDRTPCSGEARLGTASGRCGRRSSCRLCIPVSPGPAPPCCIRHAAVGGKTLEIDQHLPGHRCLVAVIKGEEAADIDEVIFFRAHGQPSVSLLCPRRFRRHASPQQYPASSGPAWRSEISVFHQPGALASRRS